jgi:hypothetical protein
MMKIQPLAFPLIFGSLLLVAHAGEKDLRPRFELARDVEGSFTTGQRGRLVVPGDVFGQSRDFPNDLRILGRDGTQWPYFLHIPKETAEAGELEPEILNRSFVSGREPYLQFDLVIPRSGGEKPVHNQIELATSGHDFVRRVEVFSDEPEEADGLMAVGHLIDFSRQRGARNRTVRYPASDSSRLHVRIYSNAQKADESFSLTAVKLRYRTVAVADRERVDAVEVDVPDREKEKGAQTRMFDLGHVNRPAGFVIFKVETASYARSVSVYGRNDGHEPWKWVGGGEIHALEEDEQLEIKLRARHRFLKLHIFHYDDQPLSIHSIQLEVIPRYLIFEAASDGQAGLYYRAWDLKPSRYDLKGRIKTEAIAELPVYQLLKVEPNETARSQPWRKYSKVLGILAVAAVSLLVIGIIVSMLRQQKLEEGK